MKGKLILVFWIEENRLCAEERYPATGRNLPFFGAKIKKSQIVI